MFVLYVVAYLDRINVGFAALQMRADLGFDDRVYGLGAGIFFLGYFLFEVPSNLVLERVGARLWIARIMVTWGLIASDDGRAGRAKLLPPALSPRRRGGGFLPRDDSLPHLLVP